MAVVVQTEDFTAKVFPFKQPIPYDYDRGRSAAVPFGQAIVNETLTLDAISAGDTAAVSIGIYLPPNYCSMMRSFHMNKKDVFQGSYLDGAIGLAYQNPGGPYGRTMAELPEIDYLFWSLVSSEAESIRFRDSTAYYVNSWTIADKTTNTTALNASVGTDNPMNVPLWVDPTYPGRTVLILITAPGSSNTLDVRLNLVFDLFTYEQAFAAEVMSTPRSLST
jgi:hypothetical protein